MSQPTRRIIGQQQADLLWQLHDGEPRLAVQLSSKDRSSRDQSLRKLAHWHFVRLWLAPHNNRQRRWVQITSQGRAWLYLWPAAPKPSATVKNAKRERSHLITGKETHQ